MKKKDNTTLSRKVALRMEFRREGEPVVVLETHGGYGDVWKRCYSDIKSGVVFETKARKAEALSVQRPTWRVYQCDCVQAIEAGALAGIKIDWVDVDPYGDPWPVIESVFCQSSMITWPEKVVVVVNDGLRQKLQRRGGWSTGSMEESVKKWGNDGLYHHYKDVCLEMFEEKAAQSGFIIQDWTAYYCGHNNNMTHYGAVVVKDRAGLS